MKIITLKKSLQHCYICSHKDRTVPLHFLTPGRSWHVVLRGGSTSMGRRWKLQWTAWNTRTDTSWMRLKLTFTCSWRRSVNTAAGGFNQKITSGLWFICVLQDSYGRYLKSPVFKDTLKKAICPDEHKFTWDTTYNSFLHLINRKHRCFFTANSQLWLYFSYFWIIIMLLYVKLPPPSHYKSLSILPSFFLSPSFL